MIVNTISFDMAKKMKAAGFLEDTNFYWSYDKCVSQEKLITHEDLLKCYESDDFEEFSAPTTDELLSKITNADFDKYMSVKHIGHWATKNLIRDIDKLAGIWIW